MPDLIYELPPLTQKAVDFCWETQRILTTARFNAWPQARSMAYLESQKQLWRRFPRGIRTAAHSIFMEQLQNELGKQESERHPDKPVWINEEFGIKPGTGASPASRADAPMDGGIIITP